jgi:hypothetical protein
VFSLRQMPTTPGQVLWLGWVSLMQKMPPLRFGFGLTTWWRGIAGKALERNGALETWVLQVWITPPSAHTWMSMVWQAMKGARFLRGSRLVSAPRLRFGLINGINRKARKNPLVRHECGRVCYLISQAAKAATPMVLSSDMPSTFLQNKCNAASTMNSNQITANAAANSFIRENFKDLRLQHEHC